MAPSATNFTPTVAAATAAAAATILARESDGRKFLLNASLEPRRQRRIKPRFEEAALRKQVVDLGPHLSTMLDDVGRREGGVSVWCTEYVCVVEYVCVCVCVCVFRKAVAHTFTHPPHTPTPTLTLTKYNLSLVLSLSQFPPVPQSSPLTIVSSTTAILILSHTTVPPPLATPALLHIVKTSLSGNWWLRAQQVKLPRPGASLIISNEANSNSGWASGPFKVITRSSLRDNAAAMNSRRHHPRDRHDWKLTNSPGRSACLPGGVRTIMRVEHSMYAGIDSTALVRRAPANECSER